MHAHSLNRKVLQGITLNRERVWKEEQIRVVRGGRNARDERRQGSKNRSNKLICDMTRGVRTEESSWEKIRKNRIKIKIIGVIIIIFIIIITVWRSMSVDHLCMVCHNTHFMQWWLSIKKYHITIIHVSLYHVTVLQVTRHPLFIGKWEGQSKRAWGLAVE